MNSPPPPPGLDATFDALAPYVQELLAEVISDTAQIRDELVASEPETLLTQLSDVAAELLELVEILASRSLNRHQLELVGNLEMTANVAAVQAQDVCAAFEV
mgnify:CR=1 FL=1